MGDDPSITIHISQRLLWRGSQLLRHKARPKLDPMGNTLHVFRHAKSDLATVTPDRSGQPLLACVDNSNPDDWKYLGDIDEDDLPKLVSNHLAYAKGISDNNFFHLDVRHRLSHPFFTRHKLKIPE